MALKRMDIHSGHAGNSPGIFRTALFVLVIAAGRAQAQPTFQAGQDPRPAGQLWQRVDLLSDEFKGKAVDESKWQIEPVGNGWTWDGRPPGLFKASNIAIKDGKMCVTVSKLPEPVVKRNKTFTHQGAIVRSHHPGQVGWYFECKMKANATVMSSTFWLMTKGRTEKKLEMDIQECVGRTTDKTEEWGKNWDQIFHSNLIHRTNKYNKEKVQLQGQVTPPTKNYERYYVYGAWWKSPEEVRFYLDGKYTYSIHPKVAWDVPAFIQMAIETYSWNPVPQENCLIETGTWEQRTTQYEWVRTWKLVDESAKTSKSLAD